MMAFYNTHSALDSTGGDLTSAKTAKRQLAVEYSRFTDYVHSRDNSFQRVSSGMILNALSVMTSLPF